MTTPAWNLEQDWPKHLEPKKPKAGLPVALFSAPIELLTIPDQKYSLSLANPTSGIKRLVIDIEIETGQKVSALAVMPGVVSATGSSVTLRTHLLSTLGASSLLSEMLKKSVQMPVEWFRSSWMAAGLIPETIVYGNITASQTSGTVHAGDVLGSLGNHPTDPSKRRLTISIEYSGSTAKNPKGMHPREFFSLLFWRADHDPILTENPTPYKHPLFRSMMSTDEDGKHGPANSFINASSDKWLALRPPLRIYQRVKWEHIKEHLRNDYGSGTWTGSNGSVQKRIQNPYLYNGGSQGYKKYTKCNVYAGEILFRSGMRTLAYGLGITCSSGHLPRFIKYCSPGVITKHFTASMRIKGKIHHDSTSPDPCSGSSTPTHEIFTVFGDSQTCSANTINKLIEGQGAVFLVANHQLKVPAVDPPNNHTGHVAIVEKVVACSYMDGLVAKRKLRTIQQWNFGFSRSSYADVWESANVADSVIVRVRPGGDPTEGWGALDLNCLKVP